MFRLYNSILGGFSSLLPLCDFERRILYLAIQHIPRPTKFGRLLRSFIHLWIISRLYLTIFIISRFPLYLILSFFKLVDCTHSYDIGSRTKYIQSNNIVIDSRPVRSSRDCSRATSSPASPSLFSFRLLSDGLPLALHANVQRSDFDPDFVAALLSRGGDDAVVDIILDTGCTFAITPDRKDFIEYHDGSVGNVQTVNGPTAMVGHGLVRWTLISEDGSLSHLIVPCHHVPASKVRLLSPQDFCLYSGLDRSRDQYGGNSNYFWMNSNPSGVRFQCPIDPRSNLPVALAKLPCHRDGQCTSDIDITSHPPCSSCNRHHIANLSVFDESNQNITASQKELLLWHSRFGHLGFSHVQAHMRPRETTVVGGLRSSSDVVSTDPCIIPKISSTATCKPPLCAACQIARAKRRSIDGTTTLTDRELLLKIGNLEPGGRVSLDQYESSVRGRLSTSRGKESFGTKYCGGTIFCDHASGLVQCFHQVSLRASDTLISKRAFERMAKSCGTKITKYHATTVFSKRKSFQMR